MTDKRAKTRYPLHPLLAERWSPRAFEDRPVEPDKLGSLFEAARWAPSCFNDQPWSFVLGTREDPATFEAIASTLAPANRAWANQAPVLILASARTTFARSGKPNRHALYDLGGAVAHLSIQAQSLGLSVHQMAGFDVDAARAALAIPEGYEPVTAIAVGYRAQPNVLSEELAQREELARERQELAAMVFAHRWGESYG